MSAHASLRTFDNLLAPENREAVSITVFCKSLYAFLFVKILFLWPVLPDVQRYLPVEFKSSLQHFVYAPIKIAHYDLTLFLVVLLVLLVIAIVLRLNYVTATLVFWFSFSLSCLARPVGNGSDYVLNVFLFLSIFLPVVPAFKPDGFRYGQRSISNFVFLLCRIQFCLIYLMSGFDKLTSPAWQSGDAVYSITRLDYFINPHITMPDSKTLYVLLAWMIILFELLFPVLVWFRRLRVAVLAMGVIFHLVIIFGLSLPDFGLLMILLYSLFIPFRKTAVQLPASNLR